MLEENISDAEELFRGIDGRGKAGSLGYLTDCGYLPENRRRIGTLLTGVTLLLGECAFLARDARKARTSHHLCTTDWNELLAELRPPFFLPFHLSKTYLGLGDELYRELSPPLGTTILRLPEHRTPRPVYAGDCPAGT